MKRVLLTGMSGTGKSTVIRALAARGYKAVDTDTEEWLTWVTVPRSPDRAGAGVERDWVWREDRMQRLLTTADADVLLVVRSTAGDNSCDGCPCAVSARRRTQLGHCHRRRAAGTLARCMVTVALC
jgi:hypothetical protein